MIFSKEQVKTMLGGKWPPADGFCFEAVECFRVEDDGEEGSVLVPYDGAGSNASPCPCPDLELIMVQ